MTARITPCSARKGPVTWVSSITPHPNLHKTFSTPHGGGGQAQARSASAKLKTFLRTRRSSKQVYRFHDSPYSIGALGTFYGNASVYIRAYVYLLSYGKEHIKDIGPCTRRIERQLRQGFAQGRFQPADQRVHSDARVRLLDGLKDQSTGVKALDIAKDCSTTASTLRLDLFPSDLLAIIIDRTDRSQIETLDHFISVPSDGRASDP